MLLPMILWQLLLHWQMLLPTFIALYWFMTDVIAKDYDYSFFSQMADVIAFIVLDVNHIWTDIVC